MAKLVVMSTDDDDLAEMAAGAAVAAGLVGLGFLGLAAWQSREQRKDFKAGLAEALSDFGFRVVSSELARTGADAPVWRLVVNHPAKGLVSVSAAFVPGTDPYSQKTLKELVGRAAHRLQAA